MGQDPKTEREFKEAVNQAVTEIISVLSRLPEKGDFRVSVVKTALFHTAASFITATTDGKISRNKAMEAWALHFRKFTNDQKKLPFPARKHDA